MTNDEFREFFYDRLDGYYIPDKAKVSDMIRDIDKLVAMTEDILAESIVIELRQEAAKHGITLDNAAISQLIAEINDDPSRSDDGEPT